MESGCPSAYAEHFRQPAGRKRFTVGPERLRSRCAHPGAVTPLETRESGLVERPCIYEKNSMDGSVSVTENKGERTL